MEFWKMNGAGNDFIVVDDRRNAIPENRWPEIVRVLCERHMSIGADGFMVVKPPTCGGDYKMLFFNSDGSTGEMCGNGARCICRYGYRERPGRRNTAGRDHRRSCDGLANGANGYTVYGSTIPAICGWTARWRWTASPMAAPMWSWATPASPTRRYPSPGLRDYRRSGAAPSSGRTLRHYPAFPQGRQRELL